MQIRLFIAQALNRFLLVNQSVKKQFHSIKHLIVGTANRIMEILPDGTLIDKITTYDEYLESDEMARKRTVYTSTASQEEDD